MRKGCRKRRQHLVAVVLFVRQGIGTGEGDARRTIDADFA
jgi:hypothetical protein